MSSMLPSNKCCSNRFLDSGTSRPSCSQYRKVASIWPFCKTMIGMAVSSRRQFVVLLRWVCRPALRSTALVFCSPLVASASRACKPSTKADTAIELERT